MNVIKKILGIGLITAYALTSCDAPKQKVYFEKAVPEANGYDVIVEYYDAKINPTTIKIVRPREVEGVYEGLHAFDNDGDRRFDELEVRAPRGSPLEDLASIQKIDEIFSKVMDRIEKLEKTSNREDAIDYFLSLYEGKKVGNDSVYLSKPSAKWHLPLDIELNVRGENNLSFIIGNLLNYDSENKTFYWNFDNPKPYVMKSHDDKLSMLSNHWKSTSEEQEVLAKTYLNALK